MECIYCASQTRVTNSRSSKSSFSIWRRRQCQSCKEIFTTTEAPDLKASIVVKNIDGTLEPFSPDKVFMSILYSCNHRKSPLDDARALTNTFTKQMMSHINTGIIDKTIIQKICSDILINFDKASHSYYNAYYVCKNN